VAAKNITNVQTTLIKSDKSSLYLRPYLRLGFMVITVPEIHTNYKLLA